MTYSQPLILITNDDGIHSDGINLLQKIIKKYSSNLLVIAPNKNNSGAGHSITLSRPIRIKNIKNNMYSCDGTPTDCVLIGIKEVLKGKKPDLIISGINEGANLGDDLTYSGTVCAAMEGALLGINSLALSLEIRNKSMIPDWNVVDGYLDKILRVMLNNKLDNGVFLNVNFPDIDIKKVKGIKIVKQARRKPGGKFLKKTDSKGRNYFLATTERIGNSDAGTDVWAINNNYLSVTPLNIDLTSKKSFKIVERYFDD